jgi:hypothetical protein
MHLGKIIKTELSRQKRGVTWFADELCCDRSNVYKIFARHSIDSDLMFRISVVLNFNLFDACSEAYEARKEEVEREKAANVHYNKYVDK